MRNSQKRLNIFIDETGEFGFKKNSAKLYGVATVFHAQDADISCAVATLARKFAALNFDKMVHMGDLVAGHGDFAGMTIAERRKIYSCFYRFATQVEAKYCTIFVEKKNADGNRALADIIEVYLKNLIEDNLRFLQNFDEIVMYYDGGQAPLNRVINDTFGRLGGYRQNYEFDHTEKKLFQVADMLTYVDKIIYKYNKGVALSKTEQKFFSNKNIKTAINELKSHRLKSK